MSLRDALTDVFCAISLCLCCTVLGLATWVHCTPAARQYTRRVSFRLVLWSLVAQIPYDIAILAMYASPTTKAMSINRPYACAVGLTVYLQAMTISNCFLTCIAVNLAVITCLGINPIERGLEKWYILSSLGYGIVIPIIPAALGHSGVDPYFGQCYITVHDVPARVKAFVVEFILWQLLLCAVAFTCVGLTVGRLYRQVRATRRALYDETPSAINADDLYNGRPSDDIAVSPRELGTDTLPDHWAESSRISSWRVRLGLYPSRNPSRGGSGGHLQNRMPQIALRICAYPLALASLNVGVAVTGILLNQALTRPLDLARLLDLALAHRILHSCRGVVLASICLLIDPCLKRGVRAAWSSRRSTRQSPCTKSENEQCVVALPLPSTDSASDAPLDQDPERRFSLFAFLEISPLRQSFAMPSSRRSTHDSACLDFETALRTARPPPPPNGPLAGGPPHLWRSVSRPRIATVYSHSRSFAGVKTASLPTGLSDDVDVDLRLWGTRPTDTERCHDDDVVDKDERRGVRAEQVSASASLEGGTLDLLPIPASPLQPQPQSPVVPHARVNFVDAFRIPAHQYSATRAERRRAEAAQQRIDRRAGMEKWMLQM